MKNIYLDFETTGLNILKCEPIEISVLFTKDYKVIDKITKYIKFEKKWEDLSDEELSALKFNNILSSEDLDNHNSKAYYFKEVLKELLEKTKKFSSKKISISGWNNSVFDITILLRAVMRENIYIYDYFDYHARDVMCMFMPYYELEFENKLKSLSLREVHKFLIGTIKDEEFHNAEIDCLATIDIDKWIHKRIKENN